MADTLEFYRTRAAEEHKRAEEATLENVRERCQRAEAAWMAMAARAEGVANARKQRDESVVHAQTAAGGSLMESRHLVAYGLIALLLIGLLFTIVTLWRRAQIARSIMEGRDWKRGSRGWPWYH